MKYSLGWQLGAVLGCVLAISVEVRTATADPAVYEIGEDPAVGFNLISWWNFGGSGVSTWQNAVQSVYDAGFRSVSISPVRYVTAGHGSDRRNVVERARAKPYRGRHCPGEIAGDARDAESVRRADQLFHVARPIQSHAR